MADESADVLDWVRRRYDDLTPSQKRIAEAVVADPQFVAFATVDKLADRLDIAPSTVVRFAYKLGLNGYPDLQERVRHVVRGQLRTSAPADAEGADAAGHLSDTQAASVRLDLENLRQSALALEPEALSRAAGLLASSRQAFVAGGAVSGPLADYAALTLARLRGQADLVEPRGGRSLPSLLAAGADDALLAFGFAADGADVVPVMDLARERGIRVVGVTDSPISPVGQRVDVVLPALVSSAGVHDSLVAPLAVVNILLAEVAAALPDAARRHDEALDALRDAR